MCCHCGIIESSSRHAVARNKNAISKYVYLQVVGNEGYRVIAVQTTNTPQSQQGNDAKAQRHHWVDMRCRRHEPPASNVYHRRAAVVCCIIPGETEFGIEFGGLATRIPVLGLTIGIAFRVRTADGW